MEPVKSDVVVTTNNNRKESKGSMDPAIPDGGFHAWLIVVASFLTNGIVFGIHNCYGIIYLRLRSELEQSGVSDAATKACKSPYVLAILLDLHFAGLDSLICHCVLYILQLWSDPCPLA